jgi:hypothetical protein
MAAEHPDPADPLEGGSTREWTETWWRIYHRGTYLGHGAQKRRYGPIARFDHHVPSFAHPAICPDHCEALYVGEAIATCGLERFAEPREALICPNFHLAEIRPTRPAVLQDIVGKAAVEIGAWHNLGSGPYPRPFTQRWARAIHKDTPGSREVCGIWYEAAHDGGNVAVLWESSPPLECPSDNSIAADPHLEARFRVEMAKRNIGVRTVRGSECEECVREGLVTGPRTPID